MAIHQWFKDLQFWLRICRVIRIFQSPWAGMIPLPQRVNLPRVSDPDEPIKNPPKHDGPGYDTPASQSLGVSFLNLQFEQLRKILTKIEIG